MRVHILVVCLFVVLSAGFLYGQGGANGTILGTVTDSSGAVVGNAKIDVMTSIFALPTTAPELSVTVPRMVPLAPPWPYRKPADKTTNRHTTRMWTLMVAFLLCLSGTERSTLDPGREIFRAGPLPRLGAL